MLQNRKLLLVDQVGVYSRKCCLGCSTRVYYVLNVHSSTVLNVKNPLASLGSPRFARQCTECKRTNASLGAPRLYSMYVRVVVLNVKEPPRFARVSSLRSSMFSMQTDPLASLVVLPVVPLKINSKIRKPEMDPK